ncbi:peroxisomal targeting signal 1 receptor-like isoform X2 [Tigriopus californicus]|uniref:peroxisomal targeting signal 1 receptor-like isoform X2 n=1 Tax=Tigriopus californicus TaxID=6832 RepID=UPI0027DAA563|nr:peroxisomal targeting signal 1 receptor-like isoform X2 [Tigriopus californicus]
MSRDWQDLLRGDCGGASALTQLGSHFQADHGDAGPPMVRRVAEVDRAREGRVSHAGPDGLVEEFLSAGSRSRALNGAPSFHMDTILAEQTGLGRTLGARPKHHQRAQHWVDGFAKEQSETSDLSQSASWVEDFQDHTQPQSPIRSVSAQPSALGQTWAHEYLHDDIPVLKEELVKHPGDEELAAIADQIFGPGVKPDVRNESEKWVEEYSEFTDDDFSNLEALNQDYWTKLESQWQALAADEEESWAQEFKDNSLLESYDFKSDNPLINHPNALSEGKLKLEKGDIPSAALLFEAVVQQEPDNVEAWTLLGTTQAKNDLDTSAIAALRKALTLDPNNSLARMALAVSLANESYQAQACHTLQEWMRQQPTFAQFATPSLSAPPSTSSFMSKELHESTTNMFLKAIRSDSKSQVDPDLQTGLGVLFHLSEDYEKASDCFRSALQSRPDDALLWNKLGASLANGNRPEEAVSAYHNALSFSPGFIRTRFNLGVSCLNLKSYQEAAEHFLTALNFQAAGRGPQGTESKAVMSESIWSSLRFCLSLMDRKDLHGAVDERNLSKLNDVLSTTGL